ncbi:hypothetical protein HUO13_23600 [Saccharopolyspora erythraea]|uniref:hypothetical protein n=1 Tax=Saccharopolyspora erythraea TaxID=1836 RepID=UPI001BA94366|nr:hypothetical protein [Saccharopolyspora erythraea]QUH03411.1 hypothetical protein HUO13_23600 [Saccharopolyspora erythraea]
MSAVERPAGRGVEFRRGGRVRLRPSQRADIVDLTLSGRTARVDRVEEYEDGRIHVVVALDGDPACDLGAMSQIGHRFFFAPEELEPIDDERNGSAVLVAAVGDAFVPGGRFGASVVERLREREHRHDVRLNDFGIRTSDLVRAVADEDFHAVLLVCALRQGRQPGAVSVWEAAAVTTPESDDAAFVFALTRRLQPHCGRVLVLAGEPARGGAAEQLDEAVRVLDILVGDITTARQAPTGR